MRLGTIVVLLIAYCGISFAQTSPQTSLDDIRKRTEDIVNRSREANAQVIETLKLGIVRVESQKDANDNDVGTGIVISYSPERILILTALHVVKGAKNVQVVFYSDRSSRVPAQKLPRHSDALDLAVLEVRPAADLRIPSIPPYHFTLSNTLQSGHASGPRMEIGLPFPTRLHVSTTTLMYRNSNTRTSRSVRDFRGGRSLTTIWT